MQNADSFVRWFRQVAPYVHDFGGRTFVIAFGGEMVAERARFESFIHDVNVLAALEIRLVLVHGARPQIRVASGNYIAARPIGVRNGVDFQFTGTVRKVDAAALAAQLDVADIVVVPHLGYSSTGEVFNLAWEDVAENVAVALRADKLLMFTERLPIDRKGEVVSELTADQAAALAAKKGDLQALEHLARAVQGGVARGHLVARRSPGALLLELFTHA